MVFSVLTEVYFRHRFFADQKFVHITTHVLQATAIEMRRHGLLFRPLRDGFMLLYEQGVYNNSENLLLEFDLRLQDELFYNYTDIIQPDIRHNILSFSNKEQAVALDVQITQDNSMTKPFGRITLSVNDSLLPRYEVRFAAKQTRWCYFLVSDQLAALGNPAVTDVNGVIDFDGPLQLDLPGKPATHLFISKTPLLLSQRPAYSFQLKDGASVIIPVLPSPDISRISFSAVPGYDRTQAYSEIFLY